MATRPDQHNDLIAVMLCRNDIFCDNRQIIINFCTSRSCILTLCRLLNVVLIVASFEAINLSNILHVVSLVCGTSTRDYQTLGVR